MEKDFNLKKVANHVCMRDIPKISESSIWLAFFFHVILSLLFTRNVEYLESRTKFRFSTCYDIKTAKPPRH